MLQYLKIKNLALMDEVELNFDRGFTAVTGETGAGKSILLGALALLSGSRVDKTIIRKDAEVCEVEGGLYFADTQRLDSQLEIIGLPPCEDGSLILRRSIARSKMSKIQINGVLTTLGNLQALGESWIDFHGPGEPQKLLKEKWQRELLDRYAQIGTELKEYQDRYQNWKQLLQKIDVLRTQDRLSPDELEFIQNQIRLIDQAEISEDSIEALERDYNRSTKARELTGLSTNIETPLRGDEGVIKQLGILLQAAQELAEIDGESNALADRLESTIIELEDLSECYGQLASDCEFNEEAEHALHEKMNLWLELSRKYGNSVKAVLEKRESLSNKILMQGDIDGSIEHLEKEAKDLGDKLEKRAESLRVKRQKAARELSKKAAVLIGLLGFKKADIQIGIIRESELKEYGNCSCQFLFSPNPGQDLLPLNKIASSGEIARVMLALKAILAQVDDTSVLVFDEADANVGGEIANVVGMELASLGKRHQVFSVTHLPQVAGKASGHFIVTKDQNKNSTSISIKSIHEKKSGRLVELARMLGDRHSQSALNHAKELLVS